MGIVLRTIWTRSVPSDLRWRRLANPEREPITLVFEGEAIEADSRDSVAAAILAAGHGSTRTSPVSGRRRGPFCMMGVCFECLLEIDGIPNRQSCMVTVEDGMTVRRMAGARTANISAMR